MTQSEEPRVGLEAPDAHLHAHRYRAACAAPPEKPETWLAWGESLSAVGQHAEAILKYENAIALDPTSGPAYDAIAKLKSVDGIGGIQQIVDRSQSATAHSLWGTALLGLGKPAMALAQFEAASSCSDSGQPPRLMETAEPAAAT